MEFTRLPHRCNSPIRYGGGKYTIADALARLRPMTCNEYREPFGGGASLLFFILRKGYADSCWLNDIDPEVYNFWHVLRDNCDALVARIETIRAGFEQESHDLFKQMEEQINSDDPVESAAAYFVRNRVSYGGMNGKSKFNPAYLKYGRGLKQQFIDRLWGFSELLKGVRITNLDYREVLNAPGEAVFVFLDPPYEGVGNAMYQHGEIDFNEFASLIESSDHNCLITVNDSPANRDRFSQMNPVLRTYHSNMGSHSEATEIIAANYTHPLFNIHAHNIGKPMKFETQPASNDNTLRTDNESQPAGDVMERLYVNTDGKKRTPEWYTPDWLLDHLYAANGGLSFDLDPCSPCKGLNAPVKACTHFTKEDDGLSQPWLGRVFLNPPYSDLKEWVKKAADATWCREIQEVPTIVSGQRAEPLCETVVALIPARTHTRYWQQYVNDHAKVLQIHGKFAFREGKDGVYEYRKSPFPEGLAIVIWGNHKPFTDYLLSLPSSVFALSDRSHPEVPDYPYEYFWKGRQPRQSIVSPVKHLIDADRVNCLTNRLTEANDNRGKRERAA